MKISKDRVVELEPTPLARFVNVKNIYCIHSYWYSKDFHFAGERHEAMELVYVENGSVVVGTEQSVAVLQAGEAFLHLPWEFHRIFANHTQSRVLIFTFSLTDRSKIGLAANRVLKTDTLDRVYINTIYHRGVRLVAGKNDQPTTKIKPNLYDAQFVKNSLELLLLHLAEECVSLSSPCGINATAPMSHSRVVIATLQYLNSHLRSKINLTDLSATVGYSVSYIVSSFKREIGDSVIDYLIKMRIQKACEIIATNKISFQDVADNLNYESLQYFSMQFKSVTGLTPSQFRKSVIADSAYLDIDFEDAGKVNDPFTEVVS